MIAPLVQPAHRTGTVKGFADLPHAEMHRLESGHFAIEDSLPTIVPAMTALSHAEEIAGLIRRAAAAAEG